jgi:sporulation protein YlmC with PRC-barrel domain
MIKTLIASTFLAASIALPVVAADSGTAGTNMNNMGAAGAGGSGMTTGGTTTNNGTMPMKNGAAAGSGAADTMHTNSVTNTGETALYGRNVTVSNIVGASVMDSGGNSIGEINDIVLSGQGQVTNYVIDVGGFLGIGEKRVALTPQDVTITADASGNLQAKTQLTKDALTARPDYTKPEVPAANDGAAGTAPTGGAAGTTK